MTHDWLGRVLTLIDSGTSEFEGSIDRYGGGWQSSGSIGDRPEVLAVDTKRHVVYLELIPNDKTSDAHVELTMIDDRSLRPTGASSNFGRVAPWKKLLVDAAGNLVFLPWDYMTFGVLDAQMHTRFSAAGGICAATIGNDRLTYVVSCGAKLTAYDPKTYRARYSMQIGTESIMRSDQQSQVVVDSTGRIYLANNNTHSLEIYLPGKAKRVASRSVGNVQEMAIDKEDNVYVIGWPLTPGKGTPAILVFKKGSLSPIRRYAFDSENIPFAMTIVE